MTTIGGAGRARQTAQPQFSIVSAAYNVERYLDDFIESIEAQTLPLSHLEVVVVDDGSTDGTLAKLQAWAQRRPDMVTVLTKENGGQGSARNLGIEHATGTWVTFTDPDDRLDPAYLERVHAFLEGEPKCDLVATRLVVLDDETGEVSNTHPVRGMYRDGDVARRLNESSDYFVGSAPASFFRRERLRERRLRFDDRVRPHFEDGHFTASYLLGEDDPVVGFVGSARYLYRRRADGTSTLQRSIADPRRYTDALEHGYLDTFRQAKERFGVVPAWLQSLVLYDLSWYFSSYERHTPSFSDDSVASGFHRLLAEITRSFDDDTVESFQVRPLKREWRAMLEHGYEPGSWHEPAAVITGYDDRKRLVRLSYLFTGSRPEELLRVRGRAVSPYSAKTRAITFHGRVLVQERILWVSARASVRLQLGGRDVNILFHRPHPRRTLLPGVLRREFEPVSDESAEDTRSTAERRLQALASSRLVRRLFGDAWVLIDRIHDADDSAEHLFRHLRRKHRDVNAWFVVEKGTPDWHRLRKDGFKRVVPFGSLRWKLLMLNARHLISSHADGPIIDPPDLAFAPKPWRFTFLQHGVIKDDLSKWLNPKPIDCFVTSTRAEFESIAGDGTPYVFTTKETVLTGLPRFDLLRGAGRRVAPEARDLVLVSPTWRNWLAPPLLPGVQRRTEFGSEFYDSEFLARWLELLGSDEIADACSRHGRRLALLPHPNLIEPMQQVRVPEHVERLSYVGTDVRQLFARAALLVTDYSSTAFNAAYIDRPVVYYQFDRDRVLGGDHVGQAGYFDYFDHGFGPVATSQDEVVADIVKALEHGPAPAEPYRSRIEATFGPRDGRCCERVTRAIRDLDKVARLPRRPEKDGPDPA